MHDPRLISATPAMFTEQMAYLTQHYSVVSLEDVLKAVTTGARLPKRPVLLTFDDAYRDFGDTVWPILNHYGLPSVLFVPTSYPDHPERAFWWDRLYQAMIHTSRTELSTSPWGVLSLATAEQRHTNLRRLQSHLKTLPHDVAMQLVHDVCAELYASGGIQGSVLSWDELRRLAGQGVTLAAHTQTHPLLTQMPPEAIRQEIEGSQSDLQREIGHVLPVFSYPGGGNDDQVVSLLQEAGFVMAFATRRGETLYGNRARDACVLLRLRRTNITQRTSLPVFRLRLSHLGTFLDEWRYRSRDWLIRVTRG